MARGLLRVSDQVISGAKHGSGAGLGAGLESRPSPVKPPGGSLPWYSNPMTVRKVDDNSTAMSVSDSTDETVIASLVLPPMVLASTGAARLTATGTITRSTSAGDLVLRMRAADEAVQMTVLETTGIEVAQSTSPHAWALEAMMLGKQPNVNRGWGWIDIASGAASGMLSPSTYTAVGFSTMGLNEMHPITVTVTAQWSDASTNLTATREVAILEAIN